MILEEMIGLLGKKRFEEYFEEYVKENVWFVIEQKENYTTKITVENNLKNIFMYVEYEKVDMNRLNKEGQEDLKVKKVAVNDKQISNNQDLTVKYSELNEMMGNVKNITDKKKKELCVNLTSNDKIYALYCYEGNVEKYSKTLTGVVEAVKNSEKLKSEVENKINQEVKKLLENKEFENENSLVIKEIVRYINYIKINQYKQKIYYGVPGCGKSYTIKKELDKVIESAEDRSSRIFRVTVHPDYSYGDFIGSIMPKVREGKISYEFVPGIFTRALKRALELKDKNENVYLIVEEMTRGNIAEIFGDIFQLLDRDENGESEYEIDNENIYRSIYKHGSSDSDNSEENETKKPENERWLSNNKIKLPANFYIWGTLNTSDQNVFIMDNAFKRRFNFQLIKADGNKAEMDEKLDNELKKKFFKSFDENQKFWRLDNDFVKELNNYIIKQLELNEDKQIGNYFIKISGESQEFANVMANKLLYYLWYDVQKVTYGDKYIFNKDKITKFEDIFDRDNLNDIFSKNFYEEVINKVNKKSENEGNENE